MSSEITEAAAAGGAAAVIIRMAEPILKLLPRVWSGRKHNGECEQRDTCPAHDVLASDVGSISTRIDAMGKELTAMLVAAGRLEERLIGQERTLDRIMQRIGAP